MDKNGRTRFWIALEDLCILLSIFALWPAILGWEGWIWEGLKYVAVVGLIWIFTRRVKRYQVGRETDSSNN